MMKTTMMKILNISKKTVQFDEEILSESIFHWKLTKTEIIWRSWTASFYIFFHTSSSYHSKCIICSTPPSFLSSYISSFFKRQHSPLHKNLYSSVYILHNVLLHKTFQISPFTHSFILIVSMSRLPNSQTTVSNFSFTFSMSSSLS